MATCYDCIHCEACSDAGDSGFSSLKEDVSKCKHFKNKADVVEVETIKAWLREIAIHNMNGNVKLTLFAACQDIISRLDGLRRFAQERSDT